MATTYHINPAHDGAQQDDQLIPPFALRWTRELGNNASYPVIANGRVFITVRNDSTYGSKLYALDAETGLTLWSRSLGGDYYWSAIAYESGRVFALDHDGLMVALDEDSGATLWARQLPGQYHFDSSPIAQDGIVYTGGAGVGGTLYAVKASTGDVLWTQPVENGNESSPALGGGNVFVSYACFRIHAFDRDTGARAWDYYTGCSGGGGNTSAYYRGRLYARDYTAAGRVLDASTGRLLDTFTSKTLPAFSGSLGFFNVDGSVEAHSLDTGTTVWSFGDGSITSAPLVINDKVIVGSSSGKVSALDRDTGTEVWSDNVLRPIQPSHDSFFEPPPGLGAGEGLLVVPAEGGHIVAFERSESTVGPPTVVYTVPADGESGVPATTNVKVAFSESMDHTATQNAFSLSSGSGGPPVQGTFSWQGNIMVFDPTSDLAAEEAYTARVAGGLLGARDTDGTALVADETWTFTTGAATSPPPPEEPVTAAPDRVEVKGKSSQVGGDADDLSEDDNQYFEVGSGGGRAEWLATFGDVPQQLAQLEVNYKGKSSRSCAQKIKIQRFSDGEWVTLDSRKLGSSETSIDRLRPSGSLDNYVNADGEMVVRVRCSRDSGKFITSADLLTIEYEPE